MINFNDLNKRQVSNYSTFQSGVVDSIEYTRPTQYIQAYLQSQHNAGILDIVQAKKHFASVGITTATINTQVGIFKRRLADTGQVAAPTQVKLKYPLKSINDLSNFTIIAILDNNQVEISIVDDKLFKSDKVNKIAIQLNGNIIVVTDK